MAAACLELLPQRVLVLRAVDAAALLMDLDALGGRVRLSHDDLHLRREEVAASSTHAASPMGAPPAAPAGCWCGWARAPRAVVGPSELGQYALVRQRPSRAAGCTKSVCTVAHQLVRRVAARRSCEPRSCCDRGGGGGVAIEVHELIRNGHAAVRLDAEASQREQGARRGRDDQCSSPPPRERTANVSIRAAVGQCTHGGRVGGPCRLRIALATQLVATPRPPRMERQAAPTAPSDPRPQRGGRAEHRARGRQGRGGGRSLSSRKREGGDLPVLEGPTTRPTPAGRPASVAPGSLAASTLPKAPVRAAGSVGPARRQTPGEGRRLQRAAGLRQRGIGSWRRPPSRHRSRRRT